MLKVLVKKQIGEVFKGYFYNAKKNEMRPKWAVALWFLFFIVLMVGVLGGMFAFLADSLCGGLVKVGMDWLYFLLMSGIGIALGAFGSVFNTFSGLYLSKDNDLLLSMPIPTRTIVASRLLNVYLLGTMYVATVMLPTCIVYWMNAGITGTRVVCGIALFLVISILVLLLSCLLGWGVAKLSLKLKNKSFVTVLVSLVFIGGYYFVYFRAMDVIRDIVEHATVYGEKIKGASYGLYKFGCIGAGDVVATVVACLVSLVLLAGIWYVLSSSFIKIATANGSTGKVHYVAKSVREKSVFSALLAKEFGRFTASANYMLNCGLGVLLIPICGVLLLAKGARFVDAMKVIFPERPEAAAILIIAALCTLTSMIDTAVPSVSLEGKSIWIPQSLPVEPKVVLRVKVLVQILLSVIPMLFSSICAVIVLKAEIAVSVLVVAVPLVYAVYTAFYNIMIGVKMPLLNWTNEMAPIKQSGAILTAMLSGWVESVALFFLYMWKGYKLGAPVYLTICLVLLAGISVALFRWVDTKGAKEFAQL
ncbi:MAG: hypothetical protein E7277_09245 [Lachnospiraceae bacterium]|jgi:ABC-2 type transport system permease protein|nr:hypothetical protein [Lachnospiraceae bacterium]